MDGPRNAKNLSALRYIYRVHLSRALVAREWTFTCPAQERVTCSAYLRQKGSQPSACILNRDGVKKIGVFTPWSQQLSDKNLEHRACPCGHVTFQSSSPNLKTLSTGSLHLHIPVTQAASAPFGSPNSREHSVPVRRRTRT
jgi:hypothetical protein